MNLIKAILFFSLLPFSAYSQNGRLTGNVTYKYNDYVGNRADLGASVFVYPVGDSSYQKATVDNNGEFEISSLKPGKYKVAVVSKNTIGSPISKFEFLIRNDTKFLGFDASQLNPGLSDSISSQLEAIDSLSIALYSIKPMYGKKYNAIKKQMNRTEDDTRRMISRWLSYIPFTVQLLPYNFSRSLSQKYHFEEIEIKEGEATRIVVDFGITYI